MVVLARLNYIRQLLLHGAKVTASISSNPETSIEKIKIIISPSVRISPADQLCVCCVLDVVERAHWEFKVADKGHKHSNGDSEVVFYVSKGGTNVADVAEAPGVQSCAVVAVSSSVHSETVFSARREQPGNTESPEDPTGSGPYTIRGLPQTTGMDAARRCVSFR